MSECWTRSAEGNRAHFGLAVACAKRFQGRGVPMEELIGEAEAALLWAAVRFDEKRGVRFSTYAIPFALGALRELCRRNALMHIPREELRVLREAERRRELWQRENGREPTVEELAHGLGPAAGEAGGHAHCPGTDAFRHPGRAAAGKTIEKKQESVCFSGNRGA